MDMRSFGGIGVAWFGATVVAVTIAAAAVGSVRSEVTDVPTALGISASPAITVATTAEPLAAPEEPSDHDQQPPTTLAPVVESESTEPSSTTTTTSTTTTRPPVAEEVSHTPRQTQAAEISKSRPQGVSTTSVTTAPTTTTTTAPPRATTVTTTTSTTVPSTTVTTTTTTTIPAPKAYTRVIETDGGSVAIRVDGDAVIFRRAFPNNGWQFNLIDGGPDAVEVVFRKTDDRSTRLRLVLTVENGMLDVLLTPSI